jgi:SAM-dependent methyltransferase
MEIEVFGETNNASACVNRVIHPTDTMFHGSISQYFEVGESGLNCINWALKSAHKSETSVRSVLDYASGYGRVARWIDAQFLDANVKAVDADKSAVAAITEVLQISSEIADLDMVKNLGSPFDLIWMGSLITHLPEQNTISVLEYMKQHLAVDGIFVGTMHGPYVAERVRTKEKTYGLNSDEQSQFLRSYDESGFGYGAYPHDPHYGISVWSPDKMRQILSGCGFEIVDYKQRFWDNHQDVFVVKVGAM